MTDIFREVEEEVRREQFAKLWKQYGDYVIALVALIVIGIAGYEIWTRYQENQRLKASDTLIAAQQLAETGDYAKAGPALSTVVKDGPSGYAKIARLSQADTLLATGERTQALAIYKALASEDDGALGDVARVRAAWMLAEDGSRTDAASLLSALNQPTRAWRFAAREILAYADYHGGRIKEAQAGFKAIADDKEAPDAMRRRASAMADLLKNGGLANYGTVPAVPVTPPPATPATPAAPAPAGNTATR